MRSFFTMTAALASFLLLASCEKEVAEVMSDCGFSMSYQKVADGKHAEITFSEVTTEVLGGRQNCGFGFIPRRVKNASAVGSRLEERQRGDLYVYVAPAFFDPKKGVIIDFQGRSYLTNPESYKEVGETVFLSMKRFPPK